MFRCPRCSISLTYHLGRNSTFCHHCGFRQRKADACPECGNLSLSEVGFGTERIEHELRRLLPKARIGRMDRDTTGARGAQERIFRSWEKGDLDVLVGTQMVAKGHDVGGVTLVGVVLADSSLNLPDFRAAEKTFQIISQVAGRARGARGSPAASSCRRWSRATTVSTTPGSTTTRRSSPPRPGSAGSSAILRFSTSCTCASTGPTRTRWPVAPATWPGRFARRKPGAPLEILGPAPSPIAKLRNRYRWQILLKARSRAALLALARRAVALMPKGRATRIHVDVDPYNML